MAKSRRSSSSASAQQSVNHLPTGEVETSMSRAEIIRRDHTLILLLDGTESSSIDLRDPTHIDFEYQQHCDAALRALRSPGPFRALHLGGAGCGLARAWASAFPGSRHTAVEIDADLATFVRQWFDLPRSPELKIRVGDAATVVADMRDASWDVVVRDVFANGEIPAAVRAQEVLAHNARITAPDGLYMANIASRPRESANAEITETAKLFKSTILIADPSVARGKRRGNIILVASHQQWDSNEYEAVERAVRRLPLPVRTWLPEDPLFRVN
ncbi:spermidine synthase [Actinomyces vulturis]|uniref:spermidine synthase n=1 Tax=Actinomyces vulturis TaxID=1857645 RepID=UPI000832B2EC|nr:fused MFS/spermidine synthase [Actinomyces vulturis]